MESKSRANELAENFEEQILQTVADYYQIPVAELRLMKEGSFEREKQSGSYCFMVLHEFGFYGVHAVLDADGKLSNFTCTAL